MGCCDEETALVPKSGMRRSDFAPPDVSRRSILQGVGAVAGVLGAANPAAAQTAPLKKVTISFCSQFLCAPPYEVARGFGYFGLFTLPLTFLLPPAAGALRDAAGNYTAVMLAIIIGCGVVGVLFVAIAGIEGRRLRTMSREAAALG